jgi:dethiobiotin synthetase
VLAAVVCAGLTARGERVAAFKAALTGLDETPGIWPPDHVLLAGAASAGQSPEEVCPHRFGPAASPHLAAALAGARLDPDGLVAAARSLGDRADALVCEGVGGLLVPLAEGFVVRDLAVALALPLLIASRPGLGTLNHTMLTVEAARAAGLAVAAVVLTPWPDEPGTIERSNRETLAALGVPVHVLPEVSPQSLGGAAATWPLERWL